MYSNQFWERQPRGTKNTYVVTNNHRYGKPPPWPQLHGLITGQPIKVRELWWRHIHNLKSIAEW